MLNQNKQSYEEFTKSDVLRKSHKNQRFQLYHFFQRYVGA